MLTALLLAAACPADLSQWKQILGAEWIDCHAVADLTTTNNPYTDPQSLTGMGFPPPGSGTLNSKYTQPTTPPVSGLQIDGWFPDACNAFQAEPALTAKNGTSIIPGCTPPPTPRQTRLSGCLYDGGVDWEGTLFLSSLPPGVKTQTPTTGFNLLTYLPTALANYPGDVAGDPAAVQALAAVGFNPQSQPLWSYHWGIYWGLTQKIYRLEFDPEYTGYTCSDPLGVGPACVSPPALTVPPGDPDASYDYRARLKANPALAGRLDAVANTGN